ncbi:MAG TPA: hypothetical protein VK843_19110 [Planctomycetota bacterium]|nr:hypothetical protein [Planctomycetota bacterium]
MELPKQADPTLPPGGFAPDADPPRPHRGFAGTFVVVAALAIFVGVAGLTLNHARQLVFVKRTWLYKEPHGLELLVASGVLAGAAVAALAVAVRRGRVQEFPAPALRWIPTLVLGAWMWGWFVQPPPLIFDLELGVCLAAALWSAGVAAVVWRRPPTWPRWLRRIELVLMQLALCVFAAEFTLRAIRAVGNSAFLATAGTDLDAWLRAHRQPQGTYHLGFPINSAGLVDTDPSRLEPSVRLVACLGDSFGVGVVPHQLHYTTLAEAQLPSTEVYNLAVVNAGPREYRRLLETDALPLHPKLIVVCLFLGNDIKDAGRRDATLAERWLAPSEVLIRVVPRKLTTLAREQHLGQGESSFGLPRNRAFAAAEIRQRMPWLDDALLEPPSLSRERFLYVEHSRAGILFDAQSQQYADFFRSLELLIESARPVPIAFLLIPDEFQVEDSLWKALLVDGVPADADRELPQRLIGAWLAERSVPYVDLLPRLRQVKPLSDGALHVFHRHDTHFNARGNAIAADALVELVKRFDF